MDKKIEVVVTTTYRYSPELDDVDYKENSIRTIEDALEFDKKDYESGDFGLEEIAGAPVSVASTWGIVDE